MENYYLKKKVRLNKRTISKDLRKLGKPANKITLSKMVKIWPGRVVGEKV